MMFLTINGSTFVLDETDDVQVALLLALCTNYGSERQLVTFLSNLADAAKAADDPGDRETLEGVAGIVRRELAARRAAAVT